jgi:hypothetical protein
MDRFHIILSNYNKLFCFVDNFNRLKGFDGKRDKVYIFDCSPDPGWHEQLAIADRLTSFGLRWGDNLYFIRRRNWGDNWGTMLDYLRCVQNKTIQTPQYSAFMQEHYLDVKRYVKEDTIPEDITFNLDQIENEFNSDPDIGCVFICRFGIRICVSNPITKRSREFYGDGIDVLPKANRKFFFIDGGNFIVRPRHLLSWFEKHPSYLSKGDGSYGFCIVWEARMGSILFNQEIKWADMYRNIEFSTIEQIDRIEASRKEKISMLWYDNRVWHFFYGRDLQQYYPAPIVSVLRYLPRYLHMLLFHPRDKRLTFVQPPRRETGLN